MDLDGCLYVSLTIPFPDADYLSRVARLGANPLEFVKTLEHQRRIAEQQAQKQVMCRGDVKAYVDYVVEQFTANAEAAGFTVGGQNPHAREAIAELRKLYTGRLERKYRVME